MYREVQLIAMVYQKGKTTNTSPRVKKKKQVHCYIFGVYP